MPIRLSTVIEESGFTPGIPQRLLRRAIRDAMKELVRQWHTKTLPKHFERRALNIYTRAYRARKKRYELRKERQKGHRKPLVFSGRMRRELLSTIRVTGTFKRARGTMRGPDYIRKSRDSSINKANEITVTTLQEEAAQAREFERLLVKNLNELKWRKRRRIR